MSPERAACRRLRVVCCSQIPDSNWRWIADDCDRAIGWTFFSAVPRNWLERNVSRPRLSRYRACMQAARFVRRSPPDLLVTHHPLMTAWTEAACRNRACPHVAFSFNFTCLPRGLRRRLMARALGTVDRFVVYSTFERDLYARFFDIPVQRIDMVRWGVHPPEDPGAWEGAPADGYVASVGSQARDYATLAEAARRLPDVRIVVVAHADNVRQLPLPANVTVRIGVPRREALAIIAGSRFVVLPLATSETPCGHVTLVTAMHFAKAVVATDSVGIDDYLRHDVNGLRCPAGDPTAMAEALRRLWDNPDESVRMGARGAEFARAHCTQRTTADYLEGLLRRLDGNGPSTLGDGRSTEARVLDPVQPGANPTLPAGQVQSPREKIDQNE